MKVSEWLRRLDSHDIYDAEKLSASFKKQTEQEAPWTGNSVSHVRREIKERGLGGSVRGRAPVVAGYEVAAALAAKLVDFQSDKAGRGRIFWECVDALETSGR